MNTLAIGILVDGEPADRHMMALLDWGRTEPNLTITMVRAEHVKAMRLDLLIQFGRGECSSAILEHARLGLLAIDYQGAAFADCGFWEAYDSLPKTHFAIRHHTPDHSHGRTVISGAFATKYLFHLNRAHLHQKSISHLRLLLRNIAVSGAIGGCEDEAPYSGRAYPTPRALHRALYLTKMAFRIGKRALRRLLNIRHKWGLSLVRNHWRHAPLCLAHTVNAPRGHFWADPFLYQHQGKTYCFVEDFVYQTGRAHIAVLELTASGATALGPCVEDASHLSFPFLFTYEGQLYMCPESSAARQVRIYQCIGFPLQWELCHVAMDDISAADTMFISHGGKWWLMTSIDYSGAGDHCSELYLFSGDSPFARNWIAHPQNPIRIDPEGGRNAGLIIEDGKLFRGAQRQGFDQYGEGLLLYEITVLNELVYEERLASEIKRGFRAGLRGTHHISTTGEITVVDHLRQCFSP